MRRPIDLTSARPGVFAEKAFVWLCRLGAAIPLTMLAWLLYRVAAAGVHRLSWSFLTDPPSQLDASAAGLGPALMGTLWLIVFAAISIKYFFIAPVAMELLIAVLVLVAFTSRRSSTSGRHRPWA